MQGIHGKSHFELEQYVDLTLFDNIQLDIIKGIATAKQLARHGYLSKHLIINEEDRSFKPDVKFLYSSYGNYLQLPDTDPIKVMGTEINERYGYNGLSTFLKFLYKSHDSYLHYSLWNFYPGWRDNTQNRELTDVANHFTKLIEFIDTLSIFKTIGRAYLIAIDSNGYSFEHRDPALDPDVDDKTLPEFIHIRPDVSRPFYVYDSDTKTKHYVNSRVGWWNDRDIHGGDMVPEPSYAIRLDGVFTDEFRKQIGII